MTPFDRCMLCPRLCRTACPVATGAAREAAVPTQIAAILRAWRLGEVPDALARQAATLCVDCGACESLCHIHQPLPDALREARRQLGVPTSPPALPPLDAPASAWVAVEHDGRAWAGALSARLDRAVIGWAVRGDLGAASIGHEGFEAYAASLRERLAGHTVVVAHGGVATVLGAAGVPVRWLHTLLEEEEACVGSCVAPGMPAPLACCGAAEPLASHHPDDAKRVAELWLERSDAARVADARCAAHLNAAGAERTDAVDRLLSGAS